MLIIFIHIFLFHQPFLNYSHTAKLSCKCGQLRILNNDIPSAYGFICLLFQKCKIRHFLIQKVALGPSVRFDSKGKEV